MQKRKFPHINSFSLDFRTRLFGIRSGFFCGIRVHTRQASNISAMSAGALSCKTRCTLSSDCGNLRPNDTPSDIVLVADVVKHGFELWSVCVLSAHLDRVFTGHVTARLMLIIFFKISALCK